MTNFKLIVNMLTQNRLLLIWAICLIFVTYYFCVNQPNINNNSNKSHLVEGFVGVGPQAPVRSKKNKTGKCGSLSSATQKCSDCHGPDGHTLLPVLEPMFNMREMCKQIILLEDHLFQTRKRCEDCICKHFLTIEALAEEALTLDKHKKHINYLQDLPDRIREIQHVYLELEDKNDVHEVAQALREIRKEMMTKSFKAGLNTKYINNNSNNGGNCGGNCGGNINHVNNTGNNNN